MEQENLINEQEVMDEKESGMDHSESKTEIFLPRVSKDLDKDGNGHGQDETAPFFPKGLFSGLFKNQGQDKVQDSPLCYVSDLLKQWGVPSLHLRIGLLLVQGLNSGRLWHPIHQAVTEEEGAGAGELLSLCRRLAPSDGVVEFVDIPDVSRYSLKGKTILLSGCEGKNKKLAGLVRLLKYGTVPQPKLTGMKNAGDVNEAPSALVCFLKEKKSEILDLPFVFHLHLPSPSFSNSQRALQEERLSHSSSFKSDLNYLHIKALLFRLRPQEVSIPFFEKIANAINDKIPNNLEIIRFVKNVIKLVTIINHFEPATQEEIMRTYLSASAGEGVEQAQGNQYLLPVSLKNNPLSKGLIATPYDYYCAKCMVEDLLLNRGDQLAGQTFRVYEAIKNINFEYLSPYALKESELLDALEHPNHIHGWPGVRKIHEKVNKHQERKISQSTVNKEVEFLLEHGYIQQKKISSNPVTYVYAAKTLWAEPCSIALPNPKDLYDSTSEAPIIGRNPVTSEIEEI